VCTAVGWSSSNELYSVSDDKTVLKWSVNGDFLGKVMDLDGFVTDMHWFPSHSKKNASLSTDIFILGYADG
jgi:intraflagellar transport protein 80